MGQYSRIKLDNGLVVITEKNASLETASLQIYLNTGSIYETDEEAGILHFIEHMIFKGTPTRTREQISSEMDFLGGRFNAYTSKEEICVYGNFMKQDLQRTADVLFDVILNPIFPKVEFETEKGVILEEIMMGEDDPSKKVWYEFDDNIWRESSFGRRIIGTSENIKKFTRDDLSKIYDRFLNPLNLIIICTGNFDDTWLEYEIEKRFGKLENKEFNVFRPKLQKPTYHYKKVFVEKDIEQIQFILGTERKYDPKEFDFDYKAMISVLGSGWSSKLFERIREELGYVYGIWATTVDVQNSSIALIGGSTSKDKIVNAIKEIKGVLSNTIAGKVDDDDLAKAKQILKSNLLFSLESPSNRGGRLHAEYMRYSRNYPIERTLEQIDAVSKDQILESVKNVFGDEKLAITFVGKDGSVPETEWDEKR